MHLPPMSRAIGAMVSGSAGVDEFLPSRKVGDGAEEIEQALRDRRLLLCEVAPGAYLDRPDPGPEIVEIGRRVASQRAGELEPTSGGIPAL